MAVACAALFCSLSLVVWRQGQALEELRAMETARATRVVLESQRASLQRDIERLQSRGHMIGVAAARLSLRLPAADEIVILREAPVSALRGVVALARPTAGTGPVTGVGGASPVLAAAGGSD